MEALFLAGKQHETDRALGRRAAASQDARSLQNDHRSRAVVGRALGQVPRVQVRAQDYILIGLVRAADLANRVVNSKRAGDERVAALHLDASSCRGGTRPATA